MEARKQRGLEIAAVCKITRTETASGRFRHNPAMADTGSIGREPVALALTTKPAPANANTFLLSNTHYSAKRPLTVAQPLRVNHADGGKASDLSQDGLLTTQRRRTKSDNSSMCNDSASIVANPPQAKGARALLCQMPSFSATFKIYSTVSGRRFTSDLCDGANQRIYRPGPHFNSIFTT